MYKLKWVYICNMCGKVVQPVPAIDIMGKPRKTYPDGWEQKGNSHLCADCVEVLARNPQRRAEYD